MRISDWISDVCSSDLHPLPGALLHPEDGGKGLRLRHARLRRPDDGLGGLRRRQGLPRSRGGAMSGIRRDGGQVFVPPAAMEALGRAIFAKAGSSPEEAERIARRLTGANLRGHDSHGVIRIPRYVQWAADGLQVPNQTITILLDQPSFAIIDGRYGFGQSIGEQAVDRSEEPTSELQSLMLNSH